MIIQLYIFGLFFIGFGIFAVIKKKKIIGYPFILLGIFLAIIASVVIKNYPQTWPF